MKSILPMQRTYLALLVVLCCMIGCDQPRSSSESAPIAASPSEGSTNSELQTVTIKVNTMSCVEGCFNGIQSVLEKRDGIESVKLAPQKEEGLIDNSVIYVSYRGAMDRKEIERLVVGAGFDSIEFVEKSGE
jgi:periplasmic mercuric ion binding protein